MGHIGNCHEEAKTLLDRLTIDRVIKITRVFTINGHKRQVTQVRSPLFRRGGDPYRQIVSLGKRFRREIRRQVIGPNCHLNFNTRGQVIPKDGIYPSFGAIIPIWLARDDDHNNLARQRTPQHLFVYPHALWLAPVYRVNPVARAIVYQHTNKRRRIPLEDLYYVATQATTTIDPRDPNLDLVAV